MSFSSSPNTLESLQTEISELLEKLPHLEHGALIQQALTTLVRMAEVETDRLDWKILTASLQDMERAFRVFYPYRHVRKIAIFGSARTPRNHPAYQMTAEFAHAVAQQGFMVMTGGGPGVMQAGNEGAGVENSFGLNIQLPFEQGSNSVMEGDHKLINFKYFFTRKLFFLRETDAVVGLPGGFGTQDETFECLTLMQTGKTGLLPVVLLDPPGDDYWKSWDGYLRDRLLTAGLISPADVNLYTITDRVDVACETIASFYRVFHSSRYVKEQLVLRLKSALSDVDVDFLNQNFSDLLVKGQISQSRALPAEATDDTAELCRLIFHFNQRDLGRLYQMIRVINQMGSDAPEATHPEQK